MAGIFALATGVRQGWLPDFWLLDLSTHFDWPIALASGSLAGILCIVLLWHGRSRQLLSLKTYGLLLLLSLGLLGLSATQWAIFFRPLVPAAAVVGHPLSLIQVNAFSGNPNCGLLANFILRKNPDFIAFQEFRPACQAQLAQPELLHRYPYRIQNIRPGLGLYSRFPIIQSQVLWADSDHEAILSTHIQVTPTTLLRLFVVHFRLPLGGHELALQRKQAALLAQAVHNVPLNPSKQVHQGVLVAGDLNTTFGAKTYQQLLANGQLLHDARQGFGPQPSWPAWPFPVLGIDHVLLGPNLQATAWQSGPFVGSDHQPVWIRFQFRQQ